MKIQLYIATSLDGFIATETGSIQWLEELPNPTQTDHGYAEFLNQVSTVIMGRTTYEQVLSFGIEWPYTTKQTIVVTNNTAYKAKTPKTSIINEVTPEKINQLLNQSPQNCWLVGGQKLNQTFLEANLIDEILLTIAPVALGTGIPLFGGPIPAKHFQLTNAQTFETGCVTLTYVRVDLNDQLTVEF